MQKQCKRNVDLFIIAAGKGSRMGGNIPKALLSVDGKQCLTSTLLKIAGKFDNVYIVTNNSIQEIWDDYFNSMMVRSDIYPNYSNVSISSGLGDGHAVMSALTKVYGTDQSPKNEVVICWGDVYFPNHELVDELINNKSSATGIIPAVKENNPYVTLLVDEQMNCQSADFSKMGENHPTGFHDLSIFKFDRCKLQQMLQMLHNSFWKNGRYITPGGELSLLYTFHAFYNSEFEPLKVYESDYVTYGFNTPEEVRSIEDKINQGAKDE
jgi:bifunctional N-acetylglucosamine-1-phosphate-uridyltransferase/glucosamine-1-phosphate-acetyltransferase GlmU-like protein